MSRMMCNTQLCKFGINCQLMLLERRIKAVVKNNHDGKTFKPDKKSKAAPLQKVVVVQTMEEFVQDLNEIYKFQIPAFMSYWFPRKPMINFYKGKVVLRMDICMMSGKNGEGHQIFMKHRSLPCDADYDA